MTRATPQSDFAASQGITRPRTSVEEGTCQKSASPREFLDPETSGEAERLRRVHIWTSFFARAWIVNQRSRIS